MSSKKRIIQVTIGIMLASSAVLFILHFHASQVRPSLVMSPVRQSFAIISIGIFISSFVTLLTTIREYLDERRKTLEHYFNVSHDILLKFYELNYLDIKQPVELLRGCFREIESNKRKEEENGQLRKILAKRGSNYFQSEEVCEQLFEKLNHTEKNKMLEWLWENGDKSNDYLCKALSNRKEYLETEYNLMLLEYESQIKMIMWQYINLAKLSYKEVENAFAAIDFLFANRKLRNRFIFDRIHIKQRKMLRKIKEGASYFERYFEKGQGKFPVIISKILEIQDTLFYKKERGTGLSVYRSYCYDIELELHRLLKIIYGKQYEGSQPHQHEYIAFSKEDDDLWEQIRREFM